MRACPPAEVCVLSCCLSSFYIACSICSLFSRQKERKVWHEGDEVERVGERGRRGESEELQIAIDKLMRLTWIKHPNPLGWNNTQINA